MIGSLDNATAALGFVYPQISHNGSARRVFLIDGVIYKVNDIEGANEDELVNLDRLRTADMGPVRIPDYYPYLVNGEYVIAMEYIEGKELMLCECANIGIPCDCIPEEVLPSGISAILYAHGLNDIGNGNVINKGNLYYLVDAEI